MRILALSLMAVLTLNSCNVKNQEAKNKVEKELVYNEVDDNGHKMLKGQIDKDVFAKEGFAWYSQNYNSYTIDKPTIDAFKDELKDFDVTVFMGTWCSDSQREIPHFFKIMEYSNYPINAIQMYAVDRNKESLNGEEQGQNITHVPTIIFSKDGKEMGRIVESPIQTLEEDIRDIVKGTPQTPNYSN